jgi:hypothetical protein
MYLRYSAKDEARLADEGFWERILGRPKEPDDITRYCFGTLNCQDGAHDYMILTEPLFSEVYPKLTTQERNFVDANMVPASNVQVQNCMASRSQPLTG